MARQSLIALATGAVLLSCQRDELYEGAFDIPSDAAVLSEADSPFSEPVALVSNAHEGQIAVLALKQGRFLPDDPSASFLRSNWLPTGGNRVLSSVSIWAPSRYELYAFAGDRKYGQLLQIPWVVDSEDRKLGGQDLRFPVELEPTAGEPCFVPAGTDWDPADGTDCPGEPFDLGKIEVKHGYTATETWVLTWNDVRETWVVEGTRSGRQEDEVVLGEPYKSTRRRVGFTARGAPKDFVAGDRIAFTTDNGLVEHDVGGVPEALAMAPDQSALAVIVHDLATDAPVLRWFDPATGSTTDVSLDAGARPARMTWTEDGSALWVADSGLAAAWEIAPGATTATRHDLPWPILDVAPLFGDVRRVFVVPDEGRSVWMFDADTDALIDINASIPGDQGMELGGPIGGITALPLDYRYPQTSERLRERRLEGRSVAVALYSGRMVFLEEETGCLVQDGLGPRTTPSSTGFASASDVVFDPELVGGPVLVANAHSDRHVLVNPCAGIAQSEAWTLRYDGAVGAWRVKSTTHGEHERLAFEDQRYVSDNGEVSFTIRAGSIPTQDSWQISFSVSEGALSANGDRDGDGIRETILAAPGDPVFFHYLAGRDEEAAIDWQNGAIQTVDGKTDRVYVLLPVAGSDNVARVNPENGDVEVQWN